MFCFFNTQDKFSSQHLPVPLPVWIQAASLKSLTNRARDSSRPTGFIRIPLTFEQETWDQTNIVILCIASFVCLLIFIHTNLSNSCGFKCYACPCVHKNTRCRLAGEMYFSSRWCITMTILPKGGVLINIHTSLTVRVYNIHALQTLDNRIYVRGGVGGKGMG